MYFGAVIIWRKEVKDTWVVEAFPEYPLGVPNLITKEITKTIGLFSFHSSERSFLSLFSELQNDPNPHIIQPHFASPRLLQSLLIPPPSHKISQKSLQKLLISPHPKPVSDLDPIHSPPCPSGHLAEMSTQRTKFPCGDVKPLTYASRTGAKPED